MEQRLSGRVDWTHQVEAAWAPWLQRIDRQGYQATLYADRSAQDEARIADLQASGLVESNLWLTPARLRAEPALTLLLRRKTEVVGWIVGVRALDFEGIHYTVGYVLPELRRTAAILASSTGCTCLPSISAFTKSKAGAVQSSLPVKPMMLLWEKGMWRPAIWSSC